MNWRRIGKALFFPHTAVMAVITPVAIVLLAYAFAFKENVHVVSIVSYVFSAYVLTAWCFRAPRIIAYFKNIKNNKYARKWLSDTRLRVNVSLFGSLLWNTAYGIFHLWLGLVHSSFWFASLASYYILLALMRFFLVRYTRKNVPGEKMLTELKKYRNCGRVFLVMNLALSLMVFFMIYWNRTFEHGEIVTIGKAGMFMLSVIFYVCDLICVLVWCPFRLIMKNKCCTTCRIFNWDHLMMFSPLIFIGGFYSVSLVVMAVIAWLVWEICIMLYPERFCEMTNVALKCSECTDKLCTQYCQKLR